MKNGNNMKSGNDVMRGDGEKNVNDVMRGNGEKMKHTNAHAALLKIKSI